MDITYGKYVDKEKIINLGVIKETFQNRISGVSTRQLVGEHSEYFQLVTKAYSDGYKYYIRMVEGEEQKLRAGQKYKLAIKYTFLNGQTVTGNTFTIKLKIVK